MKSLPKKFNWRSSKDFCWRTFMFIRIEDFNFLSSSFKITLSWHFSRWHTCKSSEVTSCPVREICLWSVPLKSCPQFHWAPGKLLEILSFDIERYWKHFSLIVWFVGVEEYCNFLFSTDYILTPHVSNRKYEICHLRLLIDIR